MKFSLKKFLKTKQNFFLITTSSFLFLLVFILDLAFSSRSAIPRNIYWTREVLIVFSSILLGLVIYRRQNLAEKNLIYKLKTFFFSVLGLYVAMFVPSIIFSRDVTSLTTDYVQFLLVLQRNLKATFLSVFATLFLIINLFWLRDFIYYKSRRGTYRLFKITIFLLFGLILYGHYSHKIFATEWSFQGRTLTEWVFYGLLLIIMLVLSFRTSWVNYLNKRQKLLSFWGGLLLLPGAFFFLQSDTLQVIGHYSYTLGVFDSYAAYFLFIYLSLGEVSLLLHLPTASIFDKKMNEIVSLQNLSRFISSVLNYDEVIARVTELTQDVLKANSSWLEMVQEDGSLKVVSSKNLTDNEIENMLLDQKKGISGWVYQNRASILVNEVTKDSRTSYYRQYRKNVGSILGVPLISQKGVVGILYAIKDEEYGYDQDDRELLQAFANQATVAIENARLVQESLEKERLEQEIRVAQETQLKLLPKTMPEVKGLAIDAFCVTAHEVGGDYYDFIQLDNEKLGVVIADVSGKGLSAAFYMAELKGIVNAFAGLYDSPRILLERVNETLFKNVDRRTFVSMIYAIFDVKKKKMTFCRAGHCPLLYYSFRKQKVEIMRPNGIGLALDSGKIFNHTIQEVEIKWHAQDFFLFYTDGLTEARDIKKDEYGCERIIQVFEKNANHPVGSIRQAIIEDVSTFMGEAKLHDDLSLIGIKIC